MIYQNPYQNIRTADIYGARKQAGQDLLTAQENELILKQKQNAFQKAKLTDTFKALNEFSREAEESKAAQWPTIRAQILSLNPEMEKSLPKDWMSDPVGNNSQLQTALKGMSRFVTPERVTIKADEVIQERLPGGEFQPILTGPKKEGTGFAIKRIPVDGGLVEIPENILPSGNILAGPFVYDRFDMSNSMPKEEYFKLYPSERPVDIRPESRNKLNTTPQPVPNQTELPPRNFNAPSTTNRAGETNVGFPIDENAMMQQPQIMPTMGNMMLRGAGAVMADEFAPQPRNALVGGMMPQPSQFAELMPAGSAPNRFGSPGVEGIDFAATGSAKPQLINGLVVYPGRPKPSEPKETFRDMTPAEISASGRDPARFSGQISSLGQKRYEALPSKLAAEIEQAQLDKLQADAAKSQNELKEQEKKVKRERQEAVSLLRGIKRIEGALQELQSNPFFDTGTVDQYFMAKTDAGKKLEAANAAILPSVKKEGRVEGEGTFSDFDAKMLQLRLPTMSNPMSANIDTLNQLKTDVLIAYGVQAAISNKAERDALPPGTTYVDTNTGMRYQKGEK